MNEIRGLRASLFGIEGPLWSLLKDVLAELDVVVDGAQPADLVFVELTRGHPSTAQVAAAKASAPTARVVALLPFDDEQQSLEALLAGADATFALGAPFGAFRELLSLLAGKPTDGGPMA